MIWIFIAVLVAFFTLGTLIALVSRKLLGKGFEEFVLAGYRVGGALSAMTYAATTYSAFMMVGLVGLTYATGIAALGFELAYLAATIGILTTVGPTIWRISRERRWVSPASMIGDLYGSKALAASIAMIYLVVLTPYLAAQFQGVGEIFRALGVSYEAGVIFISVVSVIWIAVAGLWSVATTDAFQGVWMLGSSIAVVIWTAVFLLPSANLDLARAIEVISTEGRDLMGFTWSASLFLGFTIPWVFFALTNPQVVQRLYIPRDSKAYKRMVRYFSVYGFIYTAICVFLGLMFRAYVAATNISLERQLIGARDSVTPTVLMMSHPLLAATAFVGIIAAAISTADSIVLSVSSAVARDLYMAYSRVKSEQRAVAVTYTAVCAMTLIAMAIALQRVSYIVALSVTSSALLLPLAPITLAGIYREPKRRGLPYAISSLALGLIPMGTTIVLYGPSGALSTPIPPGSQLPMPFWSLLLSSIPAVLMVIRRRG